MLVQDWVKVLYTGILPGTVLITCNCTTLSTNYNLMEHNT